MEDILAVKIISFFNILILLKDKGKGGGGGRLMINSSVSNYSTIIKQANIVLNGGSYFPNQFNISDEYCRNGATGVFIFENDVFISTSEEKISNPFFIHFDDLKMFNIYVNLLSNFFFYYFEKR